MPPSPKAACCLTLITSLAAATTLVVTRLSARAMQSKSKEMSALPNFISRTKKSQRSKEKISTNRNWSRQRDERSENENWIHRFRHNGVSHGGEPAEAGPFTGFVQSHSRQSRAVARSLRNVFRFAGKTRRTSGRAVHNVGPSGRGRASSSGRERISGSSQAKHALGRLQFGESIVLEEDGRRSSAPRGSFRRRAGNRLRSRCCGSEADFLGGS